MNDFLRDYQREALTKMSNGCILNGGVGSGKSRTGLYYYFQLNGGSYEGQKYKKMVSPMDLYIITTAKKRDTHEWDLELANYRMATDPKLNLYSNKIVVDSWNNIKKYVDVKNSFFIFDEQKVSGYGAWTKTFLKIVKSNQWILLSATPGDCWMDYIPVFLANGFYRNKTHFIDEHVIFNYKVKYPLVQRYYNTGRLVRLRNKILVDMDFKREAVRHDEYIYSDYDIPLYKDVMKRRWDIYNDKPIQQAAGLCYILRKIVNSDDSRQTKLLELLEDHPRAIIFYNYDYERDILKSLGYSEDVVVAEWNSHAHEEIPSEGKWVYLVQYNASEGWNCICTDTIIFYSQTYSYKTLEQARGRIDRMNTPFKDLYYYHFKSKSGIDLAISKALSEKKKFNETAWAKW